MTTSNELTTTNDTSKIVSNLVIRGDLSGLTENQKVQYYKQFCESLGLNPLTQPFQLIAFQGRLRLYATKDCTEQLRKIHGVSITNLDTKNIADTYIVTATASDKNGKTDMSTGAVNIRGLAGDALANAIMKAETKAKRRVTLSICGLGILDESETESIGKFETQPIKVADTETGEAVDSEVSEETASEKDTEKWMDILQCVECERAITERVAQYSMEKFGKTLCMVCQKKVGKQIQTTEEQAVATA